MSLRLEPLVSYPKEARPGGVYLLSVDLRHAADVWPYEGEELELACLLDTGGAFEVQAVEPALVVHRYGGTYGPAEFVLTARAVASARVRIVLVSPYGLPLGQIETPSIPVRADVPVGRVQAVEGLDVLHSGSPESSDRKPQISAEVLDGIDAPVVRLVPDPPDSDDHAGSPDLRKRLRRRARLVSISRIRPGSGLNQLGVIEALLRSLGAVVNEDTMELLANYRANPQLVQSIEKTDEDQLRVLRNAGLIEFEGRWLFEPSRSKAVWPSAYGSLLLDLQDEAPSDALTASAAQVVALLDDVLQDRELMSVLRAIHQADSPIQASRSQLRKLRSLNLVKHREKFLPAPERLSVTELGEYLLAVPGPATGTPKRRSPDRGVPAVPALLADVHAAGDLAIMVGSGLSIAPDVVGGFPGWRELPGRILTDCAPLLVGWSDARRAHRLMGLDHLSSTADLVAELEALRSGLGTRYRRAMGHIFRPPGAAPGEVHRALVRTGVRAILTTNYDELIERAAGSERTRYTWQQASDAKRRLTS